LDDNYAWQKALEAADQIFSQLDPVQKVDLEKLFKRIMRLKEELLIAPLAAGSDVICTACNGACCLHGKYHLTMIDLLALHFSDCEIVTPEFGFQTYCPYSSSAGCNMPPQFRPLTCVIFNCELIEGLLTDSCRELDRLTEKQLRKTIAEVENLVGSPLGRPALLFTN